MNSSLTIPETVERFDPEFFECSFLTNLHEIKVAPENPFFKDVDGVLFSKSGDALFFGPRGKGLTSYSVPEGVKIIGDFAFYCCDLESILLSDSLTKIGAGAFSCSSLDRLTLPRGITEIGDGAFEDCSSLKELTLPENLTRVGDRAFHGVDVDSVFVVASGSYAERLARENNLRVVAQE